MNGERQYEPDLEPADTSAPLKFEDPGTHPNQTEDT